MNPLCHVSVIVPLAPGDAAWTQLTNDLAALPAGAEVIFVGPKAPCGELAADVVQPSGRRLRLAWMRSGRGRGRQMNAAARAASRAFLWFLHADSRFGEATLPALRRSLQAHPAALHYFDLEFAPGGPRLMPLNRWGAWVRSHLLGMPFGDQGFCIRRDLFLDLGGFDEDAAYGEDHLFVWQAQRAGIPLLCTGAGLSTSPRKYAERGWLRTTLKHQYLTYRQAVPEFLRTRGPFRT